MSAPIEIERTPQGYSVRLQGPRKGIGIKSPHHYQIYKCSGSAQVMLTIEHYYNEPWHKENGQSGCPVCMAMAQQRAGKGA